MLGRKKSGGRGGTKVTPQEEEEGGGGGGGGEGEVAGAYISIAMPQHGAETAASSVTACSEQGDPSSIGVPIVPEIKDAEYSNSQRLGHLECCSTDGEGECRSDSHKKEAPTSRAMSLGEKARAVEDMEEAGDAILSLSCRSADSHLEYCCRICQQQTEEPLVELGCKCRGELAKAHRSCIGVWFNTKGSNKCEICQHVATNVPEPESPPLQHFWVWRVSGHYGRSDGSQRRQTGRRFHPLWAALLILIGGLLFDVLISIFLGASALPVNIIIGVLVILGLGTAVRLVVECWHERTLRRTIQRMELDENFNRFQERPTTQISV